MSACLSSVDTVAIISFVFIFVRNCVSARSLAAAPTLSPALTQFPCMAERSYLRTLWSVSKHVHFLKKQAVLRTHKLIQKMLKRRKTTEQEARESDYEMEMDGITGREDEGEARAVQTALSLFHVQ